jgi:hypothetical protein
VTGKNAKEQHFPHPGGCVPGHYGPCRHWWCSVCNKRIFIDNDLCGECAEKRDGDPNNKRQYDADIDALSDADWGCK